MTNPLQERALDPEAADGNKIEERLHSFDLKIATMAIIGSLVAAWLVKTTLVDLPSRTMAMIDSSALKTTTHEIDDILEKSRKDASELAEILANLKLKVNGICFVPGKLVKCVNAKTGDQTWAIKGDAACAGDPQGSAAATKFILVEDKC